VVGGANLVALHVGELALYDVAIPPGFIGHGGKQRPEAVGGGLPLEAQAGKGAVQGVFADWLAGVV
jgi:hypothetical protein